MALRCLLIDVIKSPGAYSESGELKAALNSQGALAKYRNEVRGIHGSSINTVKRLAKFIEGGYAALDQLRGAAKEELTRETGKGSPPQNKSKSVLLLELEGQEDQLQAAEEDKELLFFCLEKALRQARYYASEAGPTVVALCKREQRELLDMLTLRPKAATKSRRQK